MLSHEQLASMQAIDPRTVEPETLSDAIGFRLDNSLSRKERAERIFTHLGNPYCFCYGDMAVKIEYTEGGPCLQDMLASLLTRQKSGL